MRPNTHHILNLALLVLVSVFAHTAVRAQRPTKHPKPGSNPRRTTTIDPTKAPGMLQTFGSMSAPQFRAWLASAQPAPVSTTDRDAAFPRAAWQAQISIVDDPKTCDRLQKQAAPVLRLFKRDQVVRFLVYLDNYPQMQTIAHAYIAVSTGLLEILKTDAQLNGLVAHELARDIQRDAFYSAWENEDFPRIRQLELFYDAVAASALHATNLPAEEYAVILGRMIKYTTVTDYANSGFTTSRHPTLTDRQNLIRQISLAQSPITRITVDSL